MSESIFERVTPMTLEQKTLDKCRELIFDVLSVGMENLEPEYYVLKND